MSIGSRSLQRISIASLLGVFATCLLAASAGSTARACPGRAGPSKLDYLILASIADSPHLLPMAAYRPTND
ncbi:MAG: hypothetical protein WA803_00945 [Steroidobacteraceae bacterium]